MILWATALNLNLDLLDAGVSLRSGMPVLEGLTRSLFD